MVVRVDNTIAQLADETVIELSERILEAVPEAAKLAPISPERLSVLRNGHMAADERQAAMAAVIAWVAENRDAISSLYPDAAPPFDHLQSYWENFYRGPRDGGLAASWEGGHASTKLLDIELGIPFGVPACAITPHSGYVDYFARKGFDLITYKTVRPGPWSAYPSPNLAFAPSIRSPLSEDQFKATVVPSLFPDTLSSTRDSSFVNSIGVPSLSVEQWVADVARTKQALRQGQALIVSVMGSPEDLGPRDDRGLVEQFVSVAARAKEAGADIIELNLSCPNTGGELLCRDPDLSGRIASAVRRAVGDHLVFIKISYLPDPDLGRLIEACRSHVNGVVAINAVQVHARNADGSPFFRQRKSDYAGLSGIGIRDLGLSVTRRLSELRGDGGPAPDDWAIIGIGGVMSAVDYQAYRDAGADAVQSCTGAWLNPNLATEVRAEVLGGKAPGSTAAARHDHAWRRFFYAVNDAVRTGGLSLRVEEAPGSGATETKSD